MEAHDGCVRSGSTSGDGGVLYHAVRADAAAAGAVAPHAGVGARDARVRILRVDIGIEGAYETVFALGCGDVAGDVEVCEGVSCGASAGPSRCGGCCRG